MRSIILKSKTTWPILSLLLSASAIASGLVVLSGLTRNYLPYFLIWNLFLAWIPLGIAWLVRLHRFSTFSVWALAFIWLLFFPNAPYILTDLAHLRWMSHGSWLTVSIYIAFAIIGLFAGLTSISWMHSEIETRFGRIVGWLFVLLSLAASGFGVYIGRFLRFNSWDVFVDPLSVAYVIKTQLFSTHTFVHAWGFSLTFGLLTAFCYVMVQQIGRLSAQSLLVPSSAPYESS